MADRAESEDETEELRSAALQTATSVLQIRQRADHLVTHEEGKVTAATRRGYGYGGGGAVAIKGEERTVVAGSNRYGRGGVATGAYLNAPARFRSTHTDWEFSVEKASQALETAGWRRGPRGSRKRGSPK